MYSVLVQDEAASLCPRYELEWNWLPTVPFEKREATGQGSVVATIAIIKYCFTKKTIENQSS